MDETFRVYDEVSDVPLDHYDAPLRIWTLSLYYNPYDNKGYYHVLFCVENDSIDFGEGAYEYYPDSQKTVLTWAEGFSKEDLNRIEKHIRAVLPEAIAEAADRQMVTPLMPRQVVFKKIKYS